jgi:hypothetical protein
MIWLDDNGKIVIRTEIEAKNVYELHSMKRTVLELLATQNKDFHDPDENYWAFELVKLLEPEPEQICLQNKF